MVNLVVITRPRAQAGTLAQQVAALGREPLVFPLLEIHPLPDTAPLRAALDEVQRYAMVAFVSPNAIDAAFAIRPVWPAGMVLAVVGAGSRKALINHGISEQNTTIISPANLQRSDSQSLLETLDRAALKGKQVLIIRGETGRELLGDALREAGATVTQVAAYRRTAPVLDTDGRAQLAQLIAAPNDWIITSSEALGNLMRMVAQAAGDTGVAKMQQQHMLVPHARIAETAQMLGFRNITLTGSGDEGLLAALQSRL